MYLYSVYDLVTSKKQVEGGCKLGLLVSQCWGTGSPQIMVFKAFGVFSNQVNFFSRFMMLPIFLVEI